MKRELTTGLKIDHGTQFTHAQGLSHLAIVTIPRAGSDFFQSLLDGHPQVLQMAGQFQFYPFWDWALCKEHLSDLIEEFIWHPAHLPKFKSQYEKQERWDALGETRDQRFAVDIVLFRSHLFALMEGKDLTSRNFFLSVHVAYALAAGADSILKTRLLVCHLHEHYHLSQYLRDFPEADVLYCTRDPRNALVSTVEHVLTEPDRRNVYFLVYWLKWIVREAELVLPLTSRVKMLPLEHLHVCPKEVLSAFCRDFGLDFHPCLYRSTYHGFQWWGDRRSRRFLKGFNPAVAEPNWNGHLRRREVFLLNTLLHARMSDYGYRVGPASLGRSLLALFLIPLPLQYEVELARSDFNQQLDGLAKVRSLALSWIFYGARVVFYYQRWWQAWRGGVPSVAHYSIGIQLTVLSSLGHLW